MRRAGDQLRINAQLVDAATGFERWSQTFDRKFDDVFAIQSSIANEVASALRARLATSDTSVTGGTRDPTALDAYLKGRQLFDLQSGDGVYRQALEAFDAAIAADPQYAAAHAARARTLAVIANQFAKGAPMRALHSEALAGARRAVALAPRLPDTQATLGYALYSQLDFRAAAKAYAAAGMNVGDDADLLIRLGSFKARMGDVAGGTALLERAALIDPLNPRVPRTQALVYYAAGRRADAVAAAGRALALNAAVTNAHAVIGDCRFAEGDYAGALAEYRREPAASPRLQGIANTEYRLGHVAEARAAFDKLVAELGDNSLYQQAVVRAVWGDTEAAVQALLAARRAEDNGLSLLRSDPLLANVRRDPRIVALMAELGFPPFPAA